MTGVVSEAPRGFAADPPTVASPPSNPGLERLGFLARHSLFDRYMKAQPRLAGGRRKLGRNGSSSDIPRECVDPPEYLRDLRDLRKRESRFGCSAKAGAPTSSLISSQLCSACCSASRAQQQRYRVFARRFPAISSTAAQVARTLAPLIFTMLEAATDQRQFAAIATLARFAAAPAPHAAPAAATRCSEDANVKMSRLPRQLATMCQQHCTCLPSTRPASATQPQSCRGIAPPALRVLGWHPST